VADEHHLLVAQVGQPRDDRLVIADGPVAVKLDEAIERQAEVVSRLRPGLAPRDLHRLPGLEVGVDRPRQRRQLAAHPLDLLGDLARAGAGVARLQVGQAGFHLQDRGLERQPILAGRGHQ
jgi:hypothetical protein